MNIQFMLQWQPICVQSPLFFSLSIVTDKKQHVFLQQCLTHYTALWKFSSHVCGEMNMLHSFYTGAQSVWSKLWIHYDVVHLPSLKTLHINMEHWTGFTDLFYITYTFFSFNFNNRAKSLHSYKTCKKVMYPKPAFYTYLDRLTNSTRKLISGEG